MDKRHLKKAGGRRKRAALLVGAAALSCVALSGQGDRRDALKQGFIHPPNSARPRVWWHWMNGNISEQGIDLDLNWMARVGLGGFTVFEGSLDTPQVVDRRLVYMTPEWKHAFNRATTLAERLGLEMSIASSPGWSETGGPWVPPAEGMKKLVWSELRVRGGAHFEGRLPDLPKATGTFQDYDESKHRNPASDGAPTKPLPTFSADVAVLAYRLPEPERTQAQLQPKVTASGISVNVAKLSDGSVDQPALSLPAAAPRKEAYVQFDYGRPETIRAVTFATVGDLTNIFGFPDESVPPRLEWSDDGVHFHSVVDIPRSSVPQRTVAFPATTARFFRLVLTTPVAATHPGPHQITELVLHAGARLNEFEKRDGFATVPDYNAIRDPVVPPQFVVRPDEVVTLTGQMKPDGSLDWTPPPGTWVVLRLGYSLIGHENGPAPSEATGLEVDKFNRVDVKHYLDHYLKTYTDTVGENNMGHRGITLMLTDSIETGPQNWTDAMLQEFSSRRGYDPRPYLPALTGMVVESTEASDRFLWDFRRTLAELMAQNHYGVISEELHRRGLRYYGEALEYHRPVLGDDMEMRSHTDIPMGAMWDFPEAAGPSPTYVADLRGAASIAHIYGQNIVGAESMTSNGPDWGSSPNTLKRIADMELALGVNRFEIHESTHQPLVDKAPGLTLGHYGQWFNRNETWAEQAGPWVDYLARCSYLLQQGHFFADVAYFYGQEAPLTALFGYSPQTDTPAGYGFDFVNSDVILHRLAFKNGRLVTPAGSSYRLLQLGGSSHRMTLPVLRKIAELVSQGAIVAGDKPVDSPSLADDQEEVHRLADAMWGDGSSSSHAYGKGRVYHGMTGSQVLAAVGLAEDFTYTHPEADTKILFLHRKLENGDLYFLSNRKDRTEQIETSFRVTGRVPELWDPASGSSRPVSYRIEGGNTIVPIELDSYGSTFVVFRRPATQTAVQIAARVETELPGTNLNENWTVSFEANRGAPAEANFARLISWSDNPDPGIKYFSGTSTYTKRFDASADWLRQGTHVWLDLGTVKEVAKVELNGKDLGILWKTPYRVDLSSAMRSGANELKIQVTNLWPNRMIGDEQTGATRRYTFADIKPYDANSPLLPSGLLGPVHLLSVR